MHPITALQGALVAALLGDPSLGALVGPGGVIDAPPKGKAPPFLVIVRHDVLAHDGDEAPGHEHRLLLHAWHDQPSRKGALALAERVTALALSAPLSAAGLVVTHRAHLRTDTSIDGKTGQARAAIALRFFSEPTG